MATQAHQYEPDITLVGCGRWLRRDDQAGLMVAEMIGRLPPAGCRVAVTEAPGSDIPAVLDNIRLLVIVDAARSAVSHPPGSVARMDYWEHKEHLRTRCRTDTHALSVDMALELAEEIGDLPRDVWIYAITAEDCGYGEEVSPAVARALPEVVAMIERDIAAWRAAQEACHA